LVSPQLSDANLEKLFIFRSTGKLSLFMKFFNVFDDDVVVCHVIKILNNGWRSNFNSLTNHVKMEKIRSCFNPNV
jgi:hypothetical protein